MNKLLLKLLAAFTLAASASVTAATLQNETPGAFSTGTKPAALAQSTNADEVPDPEKVYLLGLRATDANSLTLRFDIGDCCYMYREKLQVQLVSTDGSPAPKGARLGHYTFPAGKVKHDEFIGKTEIYHGTVEVILPIEGVTHTDGLALKVDYQGCAETPIALCYPPMTKLVSVRGADSIGATDAPHISDLTFWLSLLAALGAGLLLSFTPCVLPMIPILSSVIVGTEGKHITKLRGGMLSYTYVLGTAVTYAVAGAIAGSTGEQLQAYFQNIWAIGAFSVILVLLALSMFGLYELQMPSAIQSLLHRHSSQLHEHAKRSAIGEYVGVFILGLVSALIIGACVGPVLISVLTVAITTRDPTLGAGLLFSLAHGQGVILIAAGVGAGWLLPKVGPWMNIIKYVFGILLIGVAIYLFSFVMPTPAVDHESVFERVPTVAALEQRLGEARNAGKPAIVDYYADWCTDCIRMERSTLADADVRQLLSDRFVALQIDVTHSGEAPAKALKQKFGVYGPPAMLFFASNGEEKKELRTYGYLDRDAFLALLKRIN
jgi:thiol:disulfide interchange protein DsbD